MSIRKKLMLFVFVIIIVPMVILFISSTIIMDKHKKDSELLYLQSALKIARTQTLMRKDEMERELQLGLKLHQVLPPNFRCLSPKGTKVWEQYIDLERVRNRLVHLKTDDRQSRDLDEDTIWKSLAGIAPPYRTAKLLVDHYFAGIAHVPGLSYDELRPVRPRWHVKCPTELGK